MFVVRVAPSPAGSQHRHVTLAIAVAQWDN